MCHASRDLVPGQAAAVDTCHAPPQVNQSASSQPWLPVLRRSPGTAPEKLSLHKIFLDIQC